MLAIFRVCAEFHNRKGGKILTVRPENMLTFMEVPEEIREDPLFSLLSADGSLEVVNRADHQRVLEQNPSAGVTAEGKKPAAEKKPASRKKEQTVPEAEQDAVKDPAEK